MGFTWNEKAVARSGMDYVGAVEIVRHVDWAAFRDQVRGRIVLLTTKGAVRLDAATFQTDDVLLMGSEGAGVPDDVHARADLRVLIPMRPGLRSMNISVATAIVAAEALRQTDGWPA
jgi:tRNA (cytidine/uridine-2'-O-)-methyltransferase